MTVRTSATGELPILSDRRVGATCTLDASLLPERLREWGELRDRAGAIESMPDGVRIALRTDEPVGAVADLVARESECCARYTFTLRVEGATRELEISAGPGGEPALRALLGLPGG